MSMTDPFRESRKDLPQKQGSGGSIIIENVFPLNPVKKWALISIFMYCAFLSMLVLFGWWAPHDDMTSTDGVFLASWFIMPVCGIIMLIGER